MSTIAAETIELTGTGYTKFLEALHRELRPRTYLEIGTQFGKTLKLASCKSVAIDPRFKIGDDVIVEKPELHLFQMTSDDFFASYDPGSVLGGPIDLAFLDGMHLFEFLLRDFINTERSCRPESVIAMHDCVPADPHMTVRSTGDPDRRRSVHPGWWTGDVWKIVPVLRRHRPDLGVHVLDCVPTGIVLVTNLDPTSGVLGTRYERIVESFAERALAEYGFARFLDDCDLQPADQFDLAELPRFDRPRGA